MRVGAVERGRYGRQRIPYVKAGTGVSQLGVVEGEESKGENRGEAHFDVMWTSTQHEEFQPRKSDR
jgi:hypothetical protein